MLILLMLVGAALLVVGGIFWFWFRTLHDEVGPALVATVFSVVVLVVLTAVFSMLQHRAGDAESLVRDQQQRHTMVL
jgi:fatty acid desaturase